MLCCSSLFILLGTYFNCVFISNYLLKSVYVCKDGNLTDGEHFMEFTLNIYSD